MSRPIRRELADVLASIKEITGTPEYQANQRRLAELDAEYEARQREHRIAERLRKSGVPPEVATTRAEPSIARTAVTEFLAGPTGLRFLVLSGTKGSGKTFAAAESVWERGGRYRDAQQLVALGLFEREAFEDLVAVQLLVVDELGAEHPNAAFEASLYSLLDRRYRAGRKTVLCTNLNAIDFKARYCEHGLDRLLDRLRNGGRWVSLDGPSLRRHWSEPGPDAEEATP